MSKLAIILLEEIQSAIARSLDRLKSEGFPTDRYEPTVLRDEAELLALIDTIDS